MRSILGLAVGERGTVSSVLGRGAVRQRLLDMGILPRVQIRMERVAPAGDPVWVEANGTHIALRRREAAAVLLSEV